jgi:hypothetical protein
MFAITVMGVGAAVSVQATEGDNGEVAKASKLPVPEDFQTRRLSDQFYAEGAYYGDFDHDGDLDIVAGPYWFEGPGFENKHEYRTVATFDPTDYSDNFLTYAGHFNGDDWIDILCVPYPGRAGFWYANPAGGEGHWEAHPVNDNIGNESPAWADVTGDGQPELLFCIDGYMGYAGPDRENPDRPWVFHAVSNQDARFQRFTHGIGYGDVNGDGRNDMIEATGWWEQPADLSSEKPWAFHPFRFAEAAAQMLVYDVNGDGLADIITSWHCHLYGMVWWKQGRDASGNMDWERHEIITPTPDVNSDTFRVSQLHALKLVDMNGDGLKDILTGKRFWSHGPTGDVEPSAPAVLFWFELHRDGDGLVSYVPKLIHDDSGVGTQVSATDLNADGHTDVVVANKKGIFVHLAE